MSQNFEEILSQQVDEVKVPPPIPTGSYVWQINGPHKENKVKPKGGGSEITVIEFACQGVRALDDVDEEALAAAGGIQGKPNRKSFWITADDVWQLDRFLFDHLGIETGITRKEALAQAPGKTFVGTITHTSSGTGERVYANIGTTAAE